MQKIAYIIPGFGESYKLKKGYNRIADFFIEYGIKPIHVQINWHDKKPYQFARYIKQFLSQYKKSKNTKVYILGFSYGATVAFLSESKTHSTALILCSLSPYFKEDLKRLNPKWIKSFRKDFINSEYSFNKVAKKIKTRTYFVFGSKEDTSVSRRARAAKRLIKRSSLSIARGAKHNISQKEYLVQVKKIISKL